MSVRTTGYSWETDWAGPYISYLTTPNDNDYIIKDQVARTAIQGLRQLIETLEGGAVSLIGVATTAGSQVITDIKFN